MADVLSRAKRSYCMSRIRGRDTKPELKVRSLLHAAGYRFRLNRKDLIGRPDLFLPKHNLVVFIHGCFWHRHQCPYGTTPASNKDFWIRKLERNVARDDEVKAELIKQGLRVLIIWECALKGKLKISESDLIDTFRQFVASSEVTGTIAGKALDG